MRLEDHQPKGRGAWIVGMGGTLFFGFIGLSILLYGRPAEALRRSSRGESDQPNGSNRAF
ncbi:MAG: hypothetical protein ACFE0O_09075 [Opitutales bacterium]